MNILYVSTLCSDQFAEKIRKSSKADFGFAVQKFNRLIARGFACNNARVETLSAVPVATGSLFSRFPSDSEMGVSFNYLPSVKIPGIKHLCLLGSTFFSTLRRSIFRKKQYVICDALNVSVCLGALLAARLTGTKVTGIVTDIPGMMVGNNKSMKDRLAMAVCRAYIRRFDSYVLLTEEMNNLVNPGRRPYVVMEGLTDIEQDNQASGDVAPEGELSVEREKSVVYAGALFERYGVKTLIDGFMLTDVEDATLDIYGNGDMTDYITEMAARDRRIRYHGCVSNHEIVRKESRSTVLVNPRPTSEEFTKYSFPSKNMEYMASGTPVLTTPLSGMPRDYYPFVEIIEEETPEGVAAKLTMMLNLPAEEIERRGNAARNFVKTNKNNVAQTEKIIALMQR